MKSRTLSLRADRLGELTPGELTSVVGGASIVIVCIEITRLCPTWECTGCYPTCTC